MIKKTLISAVILFLLYNLFLAFVKPTAGQGQHQWQKNRILIENYADHFQGCKVVIVGTSLSARLYNYLLPDSYYNLALAGESVFDGLNIVKQSAKKPKYVLIETNIYYKEPDKELGEGVFNPMMIQLRQWLPSFREENQPANLLGPLFTKAGRSDKSGQNMNDTAIVNTLLRQRIKDNQVLPDTNMLNKSILTLKNDIKELQAEGVKVILYEIPIHCKLYTTTRYIVPKRKFMAAFPATQYTWLPDADCAAYQYSDGEHMNYESSGKFVDWFVNQLRIMNQELRIAP